MYKVTMTFLLIEIIPNLYYDKNTEHRQAHSIKLKAVKI